MGFRWNEAQMEKSILIKEAYTNGIIFVQWFLSNLINNRIRLIYTTNYTANEITQQL